MIILNKNKIKNVIGATNENYASVCNSCACGGGTGSCNTTCKGCKDKSENISEVKKNYEK